MTADTPITEKAVTAVARAVVTADSDGLDTWDELSKGEQRYWLDLSHRMLAAGVPLVLADRDTETAALRTELDQTCAALTIAQSAIVAAEMVLNDDWGSRGGGSDLAAHDCDAAAEALANAQGRIAASLRGER